MRERYTTTLIKEVQCPKCNFRILFNEGNQITCAPTGCPRCGIRFRRVYNPLKCLGGCDCAFLKVLTQ